MSWIPDDQGASVYDSRKQPSEKFIPLSTVAQRAQKGLTNR
jgi:hypothetical protein